MRDLSELLRVLSARHGERTAVTGESAALGFADLERGADAWAARLAGGGVAPGARVGLLAGNGPAWLAAAFGVWRAGATLVPISTFVSTRELGEILVHAGVERLLLQPRLRSHDYLESFHRLPAAARRAEVILLDEAGAAAVDRGLAEATGHLDPESIACILYTSGTTGGPKGVRLSHRAILATVEPTRERSGLDARDSLLSTLPLFWVAGLVIRALPTLAAGCTLHLLETFTVEGVLGALRRFRPTALHLRPPQVGLVLAHPEFEPALIENVRKGNGRVEWFAPHLDPERTRFITGYGMTEMAGYVTALDHRDRPGDAGAHLGLPLPGVELRIVDGDGRDCPPGRVGEIRVRGPGSFSGYENDEPGSGLDDRGFLVSGDLGSVDAEGRLSFVGRTKDLLRVKGINVSPVEVESVLAAHPALEAVYVVGLPPDAIEQRLVALVVVRRAYHDWESELRALANEQLSTYKRPLDYFVVERSEIPLSGTAKPRRDSLARLAEERLRER